MFDIKLKHRSLHGKILQCPDLYPADCHPELTMAFVYTKQCAIVSADLQWLTRLNIIM